MIRTLLAFIFSASLAGASEQVVWQIGTPDKSWREFAIAGNCYAYETNFVKAVVFDVGRSVVSRDWPFIQPGPVDGWAKSRVHPFTIRFKLSDEPRGIFTLRVELVDAQALHTPTLVVKIGERTGLFHLEHGAGDASLRDPAKGKPQKVEVNMPASFLRKGANAIVLTCTDGSWVQYDAVTLLNDAEGKLPAPDIQSVTAVATPLFIRAGGKMRRAVDVNVTLTSPGADVNICAEAGGETIEVPVKDASVFGGVSQEIGVPDSPRPIEVKVTARLGSHSKTTTVTVAPERKWRIYCAASSHTDIGYTDIQPKCAERHNENLDLAEDLLLKYPDFKWNTEVTWQVENYLEARKGERLERFLRLAKEGKLGVQALYNNVLTGLCSTEAACRLPYLAHSLKVRYGIPFKSAMISDVPTQEASLPTILASAGLRYFSSGINNSRADTFTPMQDKCPCWWEGLDGSRVLMMYTKQYAQAAQWGLLQTFDTARSRILGKLRDYEGRADYPYDAVFLHGAVSDNQALSEKLAENVTEWNRRYEFPKIIMSHNAEFFEYIEKKFADKIPVYRGSAGTYWEDGAGSSAKETTITRNAQEDVANAEKFLALARRVQPAAPYPARDFYNVWRNCLLYDEHTWGAHTSITQPDTNFTLDQWKIKAQFAYDAGSGAQRLLAQATGTLASLVRTDGRSLVVMNPTSWPRTDVLRVKLPPGARLADSCDDGDATLAVVKDVPACGYRVLKLEQGPAAATAQPAEGTTIESRFYRVTFDATTGAITSVFDKELKRELVDAKAPYRLNQYLYVTGGKGSRILNRTYDKEAELTVNSPEKATLRRVRLGSLGERMIVETSATMTPKLASEITVWNDIHRVDIVNRLNKTKTYEKEGIYFAFPFAAEKPTFRYEIPAGVVNANRDMLPGACLDWFTVQHFVEVADGNAAIAWASPDAPLACFQDINRGKWQTNLTFNTGHLYGYVMNNYWYTNYKAGQDGDFTFRFSITSHAKADTAASAQFGWAASNPLLAVPVEANASGALPAERASLVEVQEPNVVVAAVKQAENGKGMVLRLCELNGQPTTAHVRLGPLAARKATACNLVEEPQRPLELKHDTVAVPIRGNGLATVIVE